MPPLDLKKKKKIVLHLCKMIDTSFFFLLIFLIYYMQLNRSKYIFLKIN